MRHISIEIDQFRKIFYTIIVFEDHDPWVYVINHFKLQKNVIMILYQVETFVYMCYCNCESWHVFSNYNLLEKDN